MFCSSRFNNHSLPVDQGQWSVFQSRGGGAPTKKGTFWRKKGAPTKGNLKAKIGLYHFKLLVGPHIPTLWLDYQGWFYCLFFSLHSLRYCLSIILCSWVWWSEYLFANNRSERAIFLKICEDAVWKITSYKEEKTILIMKDWKDL